MSWNHVITKHRLQIKAKPKVRIYGVYDTKTTTNSSIEYRQKEREKKGTDIFHGLMFIQQKHSKTQQKPFLGVVILHKNNNYSKHNFSVHTEGTNNTTANGAMTRNTKNCIHCLHS